MTWLADHWLDVLGWGGSALLVYSLLQASVLRLRVLNAIACVILIVFNAMLEVWPMVGMNTVLVAINAWFIVTDAARAPRRDGVRGPRGRPQPTSTCATCCGCTAPTS